MLAGSSEAQLASAEQAVAIQEKNLATLLAPPTAADATTAEAAVTIALEESDVSALAGQLVDLTMVVDSGTGLTATAFSSIPMASSCWRLWSRTKPRRS